MIKVVNRYYEIEYERSPNCGWGTYQRHDGWRKTNDQLEELRSTHPKWKFRLVRVTVEEYS